MAATMPTGSSQAPETDVWAPSATRAAMVAAAERDDQRGRQSSDESLPGGGEQVTGERPEGELRGRRPGRRRRAAVAARRGVGMPGLECDFEGE